SRGHRCCFDDFFPSLQAAFDALLDTGFFVESRNRDKQLHQSAITRHNSPTLAVTTFSEESPHNATHLQRSQSKSVVRSCWHSTRDTSSSTSPNRLLRRSRE